MDKHTLPPQFLRATYAADALQIFCCAVLFLLWRHFAPVLGFGSFSVFVAGATAAFFGICGAADALRAKAWRRRFSLVVGADFVVLRHGIWWRREAYLARARVQYVDVRQSPWLRRFGLARLSVYTAGTATQAWHIAGLSLQQAHDVRRALVGDGGAE